MDSQANRLDCDYKQFLEQFKEYEKEARFVAVILSGIESATGLYWCPDCISALKNLTTIIVPECEAQNIKAIFVDAGDRQTWNNPEHPLRTDPRFKIPEVPTLALFEHGKLVKMLVENDIDLEENARNFLKTSL